MRCSASAKQPTIWKPAELMNEDPNKNKLADPAPQEPSQDEIATSIARNWWNGLAGVPPGQIFEMLRMMGQQGR